MSKVFQEFYCGECKSYIRLRLSVEYDRIVQVQCPMCGHLHRRCIVKGAIVENGRYEGSVVEDVCPPKSACSKDPVTKRMAQAESRQRRDAAVIDSDADLIAQSFLRERWLELYGNTD
jgi:hypothetical protein